MQFKAFSKIGKACYFEILENIPMAPPSAALPRREAAVSSRQISDVGVPFSWRAAKDAGLAPPEPPRLVAEP